MTPGFWRSAAILGCLGWLLATPAVVAANDDLDVTMRMVRDDDDLTESVVREIELSEPVALERRNGEAGKPAGAPGAAPGVNAPGIERSREARDKGREAARAAAERAKDVRERSEQRGRPERPGPPGAPERPERPDPPGASERPERPDPPGASNRP
ncbi:MAG: hypothetical protein ABJM11_04825 [Marinobacter sp.]|uniref:hypothetical protein n=1 Tax=Marinobacter sp. TaxID=50741 RepID=UPI0032973AC9